MPEAWQCLASSDLVVKQVLQVMFRSFMVGGLEMNPGSVKVIEIPATIKLIQSRIDHVLKTIDDSGYILYSYTQSQL